MRLKEHRDNWRAQAVIKRDFKHDHSELISSYKSYKNRQKWCKGKVGTKHETEWHKETWLFGIAYAGKCVNCGKALYKNHPPRV